MKDGIGNWLDDRTGFRSLRRHALGEPIPGGARWAYVFGSGLLFVFVSQLVSGVALALYYVPSADHAHTTVAYIVKEVSSGALLRSVHAYGATAMMVLLALHIGQTVLFGSYKGKRELVWWAGCLLFVLVVATAFTGYLLPWDQKAYFATAVGTNILGEVPGVGSWLVQLARGGADMGTLTLSRFYVAHVLVLPAAIVLGSIAHVYLFRRAGAAGPPTLRPQAGAEPFYPRQAAMDVTFAAVIVVVLAVVAAYAPMELGPKANPADTRYLPRPEWYYVPVFQWLKYWHGSWAVVGIVVVPVALAVLFAGLPLLDHGVERRPRRRLMYVGGCALVAVGLASLGVASVVEDRRDPSVAMQLYTQRRATERFMAEPFQPEVVGGVAAATPEPPEVTRGRRVYEAEACDACHGTGGVGGPNGSALLGSARTYPGEALAMLLRTPTVRMTDGGMSPLETSDDDMRALVAYIGSLR